MTNRPENSSEKTSGISSDASTAAAATSDASDAWLVQSLNGPAEPGLLAELRALAEAAEDTDGHPPFSEQTLVQLREAQEAVLLLLAYQQPDAAGSALLVGVAVLLEDQDGSTEQPASTLELTVQPNFRNQGIGRAILERLRDSRGPHGIKAWSHGSHAAAEKLAEEFGFAPIRELLRMRLSSDSDADTAASATTARWPDGVAMRSFVPGQDEEAWLAVNAAAFAHHPEQGAMTLGDLHARMAESWFDPAGFLLAVDGNDQILGFHWTKVHPGANGHADLGEVYVVGVAPQAQGTGLGKALTIAGIEYLHRRGLEAIMLYVDADNTAAVALYRKLGFSRWDADVMYGRQTGHASTAVG